MDENKVVATQDPGKEVEKQPPVARNIEAPVFGATDIEAKDILNAIRYYDREVAVEAASVPLGSTITPASDRLVDWLESLPYTKDNAAAIRQFTGRVEKGGLSMTGNIENIWNTARSTDVVQRAFRGDVDIEAGAKNDTFLEGALPRASKVTVEDFKGPVAVPASEANGIEWGKENATPRDIVAALGAFREIGMVEMHKANPDDASVYRTPADNFGAYLNSLPLNPGNVEAIRAVSNNIDHISSSDAKTDARIFNAVIEHSPVIQEALMARESDKVDVDDAAAAKAMEDQVEKNAGVAAQKVEEAKETLTHVETKPGDTVEKKAEDPATSEDKDKATKEPEDRVENIELSKHDVAEAIDNIFTKDSADPWEDLSRWLDGLVPTAKNVASIERYADSLTETWRKDDGSLDAGKIVQSLYQNKIDAVKALVGVIRDFSDGVRGVPLLKEYLHVLIDAKHIGGKDNARIHVWVDHIGVQPKPLTEELVTVLENWASTIVEQLSDEIDTIKEVWDALVESPSLDIDPVEANSELADVLEIPIERDEVLSEAEVEVHNAENDDLELNPAQPEGSVEAAPESDASVEAFEYDIEQVPENYFDDLPDVVILDDDSFDDIDNQPEQQFDQVDINPEEESAVVPEPADVDYTEDDIDIGGGED